MDFQTIMLATTTALVILPFAVAFSFSKVFYVEDTIYKNF